MTDTTTVVAVPTDERSTNFDWGAIIGGALIASVTSLILLSFGSAAGFAAVSPYSWNNPSGITLTIVAVGWFAFVMMLASLAGGYFTGRFRRPIANVPLDERKARDGAHGLLMWALSFILGVCLASGIAASTIRGVASAAGGAATVAAQNVPQDQVGSIVGTMMRPGAKDTTTRIENPRAEVARVLSTNALTGGTITNEDRDYVAHIVANEAKIPPDEARKRVDATIERAKQAADAARKAAGWLAFLLGAVSVLAAGASFVGAQYGGHEREENIWQRRR